ncbi:MAG: helix-turn-helix domain-containing protein [Candidatus Korarchaeota archaeon]|nr:helix-turn-helix domain-containing protein [Candidatus Korarchaeota archaeon]
MDRNLREDVKDLLNSLSPEMRTRVIDHLDRLNKTFPINEGPLYELISSFKKSLEAVNHIPSLLTDKLTDHFRMNRDRFANQFQQDVEFLIKAGDIRELDEAEVKLLTQAAKDSMEAMFSSLIDAMSKVLNDYLRWAPKALGPSAGNGVAERTLDLFATLMYQLALAKAEKDLCREEVESLKNVVMPRATGRYKVLEVLEKATEPMRTIAIASELGLAEVTVRRYIKDLEKEELVERVGNGKPYKYVLRDRNWRKKLVERKKKRK